MKPQWNLTVRQAEVLTLMADHALSSKEVGHRLGISVKTVDVHVDRLIDRMEARSRTHAVLMWDRARRDQETVASRDALVRQVRSGFVHCPSCGGAGIVREAKA